MDSEKTKKVYLFSAIVLVILSLVLISVFYIYPRFSGQGSEVVVNQPSQAVKESHPTSEKPVGVVNGNGNSAPIAELSSVSFENCQKNPENDFKTDKNLDPQRIFYATLLALVKKDSVVCETFALASDANGVACKDTYFSIKNLVQGSESDCSNIRDKDMALFCNAKQKNDLASCTQSSSPVKKTLCEAVVSGDKSKCETLAADQKGNCYNSVLFVGALKGNDEKTCEQIDTTVLGGNIDKIYCKMMLSANPQQEWNAYYASNACSQAYSVGLAKEKNNVTLCEKISNKNGDNKELYASCLAQFK